jgi:hypothetical protein
METWHRLILHPKQDKALDTATQFRCFAEAGKNPLFAVFRTHAPDNELYFTPAASAIALELGAKPSAPPRKENVSVCAGVQEAMNLCFPSS